MKKFLRQDISRYSKLGKNRKKLQKWRKPKGIHSKMRERRKSYPAVVKIGYKKTDKPAPILVHNLTELGNLKTKEAILARVGTRKKLEIIKAAHKAQIKLLNTKETELPI
jgi:large subunit ribosomal protein L32e